MAVGSIAYWFYIVVNHMPSYSVVPSCIDGLKSPEYPTSLPATQLQCCNSTLIAGLSRFGMSDEASVVFPVPNSTHAPFLSNA